ncbi:hypothetical protein TNCV_1210901 [Trichonephila clavipes]|nr:hypothetical protein TNCV_1210901 [Trichonephila clavipes]
MYIDSSLLLETNSASGHLRQAQAVNNERSSSFDSKLTVVLDISDTSTDDINFDPLRTKRGYLLSSSDE